MPGHPIPANEIDRVHEDCKQLWDLISSHDVTFLLTDTRESRWLPTLLCASENKVSCSVILPERLVSIIMINLVVAIALLRLIVMPKTNKNKIISSSCITNIINWTSSNLFFSSFHCEYKLLVKDRDLEIQHRRSNKGAWMLNGTYSMKIKINCFVGAKWNLYSPLYHVLNVT